VALTNKSFATLQKLYQLLFLQCKKINLINNQMTKQFIQIYFKELHMIFSPNSGNVIDVYSRLAKVGVKFNIGIVCLTQPPSTVNQDLLALTENFFIGHLSS
jgi:DNA helicase HerA-like ATPase